MDNYRDLSTNRENIEIYEKFSALKEENIEVIISLGNHDKPTTGFYDLNFTKYKNNLLNGFRNQQLSYNFLNELTLCQYVILGINPQNQVVLSLYDSKRDIRFNSNNQILCINRNREFILKHSLSKYGLSI